MHEISIHPYALQNAAFFVALIPFLILATFVAGAKRLDAWKRSRKPLVQVRLLPQAE